MINITQAESSLIDNLTPRKRGVFNRAIRNHREKVAKIEPMIQPADVLCLDMLVPIKMGVQISTKMYLPKDEKAPLDTLFYIPGTNLPLN